MQPMHAHILLAEDEETLAKTLILNLNLEGYKVSHAANGIEAIKLFNAHKNELHLALLDVMLPEISGFDLCAEFKQQQPDLPVIFLTAKNQSSDKITGLKLGADDYIAKPFELEELLLRIHNVLKRNTKPSQEVFTFGNCCINFNTFEIVSINGSKLTLSKREIGLLKLLTQHTNQVISRDEIIEKLWDENENASSRTIDNYILSFRKYFELNPKDPQYFQSIRGVGYKFSG
jgi:two-component system, OmpR family, alkaline phosphatase synthesis response regulator PhoP